MTNLKEAHLAQGSASEVHDHGEPAHGAARVLPLGVGLRRAGGLRQGGHADDHEKTPLSSVRLIY